MAFTFCIVSYSFQSLHRTRQTRDFSYYCVTVFGDGLTGGEALCPIAARDMIRCHWRFGSFHSEQAERTPGEIDKCPYDQTDILMNTVYDCSGYFSFHAEDDYSPDQSI